jgi:hypothetical protein
VRETLAAAYGAFLIPILSLMLTDVPQVFITRS